jgi:acyl-CoA synthetase (AMP-forming)/AMP-acid ligase II
VFDEHTPLIPEILALHGRWRGSWPAIVAPGGSMDWATFDRRTDRVANALAGAGARRGDRVALLMSNCIEMAELIVGIMKSGCVSVPLNTSISDDSAARMLHDAGAAFAFATPEHAPRLQVGTGVARVEVNGGGATVTAGWQRYSAWLVGAGEDPPGVCIAAPDPCNIIYSSGTTGEPKGIVHTHATRLLWAYDMSLALRYHSGARTLIVTGLYSNISWAAMLCTFLAGGTLVLRHAFDPADTLATIARERITHTAMVPVQYQRLLDHPDFAITDCSSLQAPMCVGSPLPLALKARLFEAFRCGLIEVYGSTEGIITTQAPEEAQGRLGSVGKPLPGLDLRILDGNDRPLGAGQPGEVVGRSRFVSAGYWKKPAATASAMWIDDAGNAWLRSGDIGRLDEDGYLYIVDRKKDLILSGGQNIFPADIEAVLAQHADVAECAVIGVPSDVWGESPLALVTLRDGCTTDAGGIRDWLNARVGRQQRVAGVEIRASLPRNAVGKLLKRELRIPYWPSGASGP